MMSLIDVGMVVSLSTDPFTMLAALCRSSLAMSMVLVRTSDDEMLMREATWRVSTTL